MKTNKHLINLFNINNSFYFNTYIKVIKKTFSCPLSIILLCIFLLYICDPILFFIYYKSMFIGTTISNSSLNALSTMWYKRKSSFHQNIHLPCPNISQANCCLTQLMPLGVHIELKLSLPEGTRIHIIIKPYNYKYMNIRNYLLLNISILKRLPF